MPRSDLTANTTYHTNQATGSDTTGDGSAGNPWATPAHAHLWCRDNLDLRGFAVTVQVNGNVTGQQSFEGYIAGQVSPDSFTFLGDPVTPTNNMWTNPAGSGHCAFLFAGAQVRFRGFCLGSGAYGVSVGEGIGTVQDMWFSNHGKAPMNVGAPRAQLYGKGTLRWMWAGFDIGMVAENNGQISLIHDISLPGAPACAIYVAPSDAPFFATAFAQADIGGVIDVFGAVVTGRGAPAQGRTANCISLGKIQGTNGNPWWFPGSSPAYCDSRSNYN